MAIVDSFLINVVLRDCHDSPFSGHLSEDKKREKIKTLIWWPMWQNNISEYLKTCDRCQKAKKSTFKRIGNMIKIEEPSRPWLNFHMDQVTCLPPVVDRIYKYFVVIVDRCSKTPIFLPFHKHDTAMDTAVMIWNRIVSWTGIFGNISSDKDPKFSSALCKNLPKLFGTQ
ncbi:hypothetical protein O181_034226 [Austropuccinia psidii MF-1]|uniref:Integrase catalytic domain-containing protein n=1 Tax=Austropuccinia psidii MF-1 TaxID=1389203 RepID=A0A9Q3D5Y3_9BASI|nr:hypothetical protein [Austropuccinia psidii MF-1]